MIPNIFTKALQAQQQQHLAQSSFSSSSAAASSSASSRIGPPRLASSSLPRSQTFAPSPADDEAAGAAATGVLAYDDDLPPVPKTRAERLREDLMSKVPEQKSKYVEQLMEVAKKRKMAQEKAYERKFLKEQEEEELVSGPATEKFVTQGYENRLDERKVMLDAEAREDAKPRDAGQFMSNLLSAVVGEVKPSGTSSATRSEPLPGDAQAAISKHATRRSYMPAPVAVDPGFLRNQQEERRESRRAPPSRLTSDDIAKAQVLIEQRHLVPWA